MASRLGTLFPSLAKAKPSAPYVHTSKPDTFFIVGDTHYGVDNMEVGNANSRQITALRNLPGTKHPLGGIIQAPTAVIQIGDAVHEATATTERFASDYTLNGSGSIPWPCYLIDGNHDQAQVRTLITARHGSLTWGAKLGEFYFQAMTENYTGPSNTTPPTEAQIASVDALLAARPATEPKFLLVHRSPITGYAAEWDAAALTALHAMVAARNVKGLFFGHDHYSHHTTLSGYRIFSPGSVTQSPFAYVDNNYITVYPESFLVVRVGTGWYDVASYVFGFGIPGNPPKRTWQPGTWEWTDKVYY